MQKGKIPKRIATMNVSMSGFRNTRNKKERIQLALKILDFAKRNKTSIIFFPSGYLTTSKISQIDPLLVPITEKARKLQISFVLGVDLAGIFRLSPNPNTPDFVRVVKSQKIPCFLASYDYRKDALQITRQRSCTGEHARRGLIPDDIMKNPRTMNLGKNQLQIIHCGEVYDSRLFSSKMPRMGVILGHKTMPRLSRSMRIRAQSGFTLVNSEHRRGRSGALFCYDRGRNKSTCGGGVIYHQDLWSELAVWEIANGKGLRAVHGLKD